MSQIQMSLLLHSQVLHWFLGASKHGVPKMGRASKNKLSQNYSLSSSHKLCHCAHQQNRFRFIFQHSLSGAIVAP